MDAIESGIVKIPRVPGQRRLDDRRPARCTATSGSASATRLPRKGIKDTPIDGAAGHPQGARGRPALPLRRLRAEPPRPGRTPAWARRPSSSSSARTPRPPSSSATGSPAGRRSCPTATKVVVPGNLPLFSNEQDGRYRDRPNTLLVDSAQLDRGDALDPAFRKAAAAEIDRFKHEYVTRFPGRSADDITDEEILREVMNTVGKRGRLGEHIRCVVSVAMLTEGWDANTVTHILGIRAFGTQLLCEQVVGRALRRASYDANAEGLFEPEYAEVYGVPFSFLSVSGTGRVKVAKPVREVRALPGARQPADRVPAPDRLPLRDADRPPGRDLRRLIDPAALDPGRRDQDGGRPDRRPDRDPRDRPPRPPACRPSSSRSPSGRSTTTSATMTAPTGRGSSRSSSGSPRPGSTSASRRT